MAASIFLPLQQHRKETFPAVPQLQRRLKVRAKRGRGKAVTWPPDDQICQIRFFLSNDSPSSIGSVENAAQTSYWRSPPPQNSSLGVAHKPPGFPSSLAKRARVDTEASMATQMSWTPPEKFVLHSDWLVANGDESIESGLQKQRELRVLEAFYPRSTCIPESPAEPVEICTPLHDSLAPSIPLIPIEEEDEEVSKESGEGFETLEKLHVSDMPIGHGQLMKEQVPDAPCSKASSSFAQESIQNVCTSHFSNADPKVAAAAAVAAACMAFHKHGGDGTVDPDLLVEILRNPTLLKSLTLSNQFSKTPAETIIGQGLSIARFSSQEPTHASLYYGPPYKPSTGVSHTTGLPSPVSVLSDWTHAKSSEGANAPNLPIMSRSLPSAPPTYVPNSYPFRERVRTLESELVHGLHAFSHEARAANNPSCSPNASAQMTPTEKNVDRSSGTPAPLAPFPSRNGVNFHPIVPGETQPARGLGSQAGGVHHQGMAPLDSMTSRSLYSESKFRCNESSGLSLMTKPGPRNARLCMYYNTPRGCRNGGHCAFLHQSGGPELNAIAQ